MALLHNLIKTILRHYGGVPHTPPFFKLLMFIFIKGGDCYDSYEPGAPE